MSEEARSPAGTLKGRLADVYVPALVDGQLEALAKRLGSRAIVDDPVFGRASSLAALEPLIMKASDHLRSRKASYRHVYSTTGVDRDVAEGVLSFTEAGTEVEVPIAVVAERRRLREIELRLYHKVGGKAQPRPALLAPVQPVTLSALVNDLIEGLRRGAVDKVTATFEEGGRLVTPEGRSAAKADGRLTSLLSDLGEVTLDVLSSADDGRTCCVELTMAHLQHERTPAMLSLERGDSGLLREARWYQDT